jgi:RNA recognition motif-containing protein
MRRNNHSRKEIKMQGSKLYVGNLDYGVTKEKIEELFSQFGDVQLINIIQGKGFGFVEMSNPSQAQKAMEGLDGTQFEGRTLRVNEAREQKARSNRTSRRY